MRARQRAQQGSAAFAQVKDEKERQVGGLNSANKSPKVGVNVARNRNKPLLERRECAGKQHCSQLSLKLESNTLIP